MAESGEPPFSKEKRGFFISTFRCLPEGSSYERWIPFDGFTLPLKDVIPWLPDQAKRKLAAILSADVQGYSRLMGEDEEGTIRTLKVYLEVVTGSTQRHGGRVVSTGGDSVLAEFPSVVDAVRCAVGIQGELRERNKEVAEDRRLEFRIGVNLGDVVEEGDTILGDGVNIAARVQNLAEAGGVCITGTVYDQIKNKLAFGYEFIGEQTVKNIKDPVRVYRVSMEPVIQVPESLSEIKDKTKSWSKVALSIGVVLMMGIVAMTVWHYLNPAPHPVEVASKKKMAFSLPDKPSIAVLPFKMLSSEPGQEFLADGITESIIGAVSRLSGLFVIASNSVFTYKGKPTRVQTVSEELGVRNVLEGTVQQAGERLRVNAQLIDATTGRHLWSEKYDRAMKDVFSIQDEISKEILTALRVKLVEGEQERVWARGTNNLEAYLKFLKAYNQHKSFNKNSMILTRQICEEAIGLDPKYEAPYALLGNTHLIDLWFHWGESPQVSMEKAVSPLQKAVALRPTSDWAYSALCHLYLLQKRYDEAVKAGEKAIALNPNGDLNMVVLGITFNYIRRYEEAITLFKEAQRRNPFCPAWYIHNAILSYHFLGKWDEAIAEGKRALERNPDHFPAMVCMAMVYGNSGRLAEGRALAEKMLKIDPGFSLESSKTWPFKYPADAELGKAGLRKVGVPESPAPK